jgi:geranylgeranylglycerol-phosphate geranylgeranyltransferase
MLSRLLAHVETCRPYTLFYVGLVSLGGALLASGGRDPWRLAGAWLVPTLGWLAGLYGGDYFDRRLDAVAKPHRPIPSGRMRAGVALAGMVINICLGLALAVLLNPRTLLVVAVAVALGLLYSNVFKARGAAGNVARGGLAVLAFVFGTMATSPFPPLALLPLAAVFWLHDASSNLVGTLRDVEGDRQGGYRTVPVRYGVSRTIWAVTVLYAGWLAWAILCPVLTHVRMDEVAYRSFVGAAAALGLWALVVLFPTRGRSRLGALRAHAILVVERLVLASALIAASSARWLALGLLIPFAVLTVASQRWLRQRYEMGEGGARAAPIGRASPESPRGASR